MLEYLKGKIRQTQDAAALEEIFRLFGKPIGKGGNWMGEAAEAAATSLGLDEWFVPASPRASPPRSAAIAAFSLLLLAHGAEEWRAFGRGKLQELRNEGSEGINVDEAMVELSHLRVFACHYAILVGQPQSELRKCIADAYLAGLGALAAFTVDPGHLLAQQDRRFRIYRQAADADLSDRSNYIHVGDAFSRLCGVEDLHLLMLGQIAFSTTVGAAAGAVSDFLMSESGGAGARES